MSCIYVRLFLKLSEVRSRCVRALGGLPEIEILESGPCAVGVFQDETGERASWRALCPPGPARCVRGPAVPRTPGLTHPLLLSADSSPGDCVCAALRGAHGLVQYCEIESELAQAVRVLAAGKSWFPVKALPAITSLRRGRSYRRFGLTEQEWKAISLASSGLANKQVADVLGIAERTSRFHLDNAYRKLGIHSRREIRRLGALLFG